MAWFVVLAWAAVLFGLSSISGSRLPPVGITFGDKLAHVVVYAILGMLCLRAMRRTTDMGTWKTGALSVLIVLGYGVSDEIHQMFVPKRSSDVLDVLADVVGGTLGVILLSRIRRRQAAERDA